MASRAGGRHPSSVSTVVRLTNDAVQDLERLIRKGDPQVVKWAFEKMIHLEQDPEAGEALVGGLMGWRKFTVGDRDWRLVWRVTHDDAGAVVVDVAEVWAFGARSDAEVYEEMKGRIATAPRMPHTKALAEVLAILSGLTNDIQATQEPIAPEPPPKWLREALLYVVRLPSNQVDPMTREAAEQVWIDYTTGRGR